MISSDKTAYPVLTFDSFHPFIRCVGAASKLRQNTPHMAYDHRMIAVIDGEGIIEVDGREHTALKGDVFVIPPGIAYRVVSGKCQQSIVINFDLTHSHCDMSSPVISVNADMFDREKIIEIYDLSEFLGESGFVKKQASSEALHLCRSVLAAYSERRNELDNVYITSLFTQLFYLISPSNTKLPVNSAAKEIYSYITENYHLPITLLNVAERFHFHPTYVNRLIKKHYGTSVKQLLLKCRFDRAVYLIDNTDMTIKEVANATGFLNPQYFSEAFYTRFGVYPSSFRK